MPEPTRPGEVSFSATTRARVLRGARRAAPFVVFAGLAVALWWVGLWLAPFVLFFVACWRTPDPQQVRCAVELAAAALVLALTAAALLIHCARGAHIEVNDIPGRGRTL